MKRKKIGVLFMAYGTPRSKEEIEPYYTHIRRGRAPSKELLDDLIERYEAVGEMNRFAEITDQQLERVVEKLNLAYPAYEFKGYLGLKHIAPFIETAVEQMKADQITEAVSLVLAPHYSTYSVKSYNERAQKKAQELGDLQIHSIDQWHDHPLLVQYWADRLREIFGNMEAKEKEKSVVIFSAHSLPEKILTLNDPYPDQLKQTARLIADQVQIPHYRMGWQSAGRTPEPWLGPDVQDLTRDLFDQGFTSFIYCPIGFVAEHLEVLYDNDIECKQITDELGAKYDRPPMPNASAPFIECLRQIVSDQLTQKGVI